MSQDSRMERLAQEKAAELGIELMPLREAFNEMRRRMIEGWTMSQQACPISGFPLVKKKGVVWSMTQCLVVGTCQGTQAQGKQDRNN